MSGICGVAYSGTYSDANGALARTDLEGMLVEVSPAKSCAISLAV